MIERVLARVGVVALAHADRREAEPLVQLLRAVVREAHLERQRGRAAGDRLAREREQQPGPDAAAAATSGSTAIVVTCPSVSDIIKPA